MKKRNSIKVLFTVVPILILLMIATDALAQKKGRTRLRVYYEKLANNDRSISVILNKGSGKNLAGVENEEVSIALINGEEEINLTSLNTDADGKANFLIAMDYELPVDVEGFTKIKASYTGNDSLKATKKQIKFADLDLDVSFDIVDSVKQVTVKAYKYDSIGNKVPVEKLKLKVGVERLFSTLFLENVRTNKKGVNKVKFPDDIPGDSTGAINIIVKVDDDRNYGTVTRASQVNWGTIVDYNNKDLGRSLYGDEAPFWMIIAVFVILAGAWYHFILAIVKVYKMTKIEE